MLFMYIYRCSLCTLTGALYVHLQVLFIYIDINDDDNLRVLEFFGLKPDDCPTLRLIELGDEDLVKYRPTSLDLSASGVQQFVQDYLDGKLKVCAGVCLLTLS